MPPSITWRVLWPLTSIAIAGIGFLLLERGAHDDAIARFDAVIEMRESLDRAMVHLSDRHIRTVRRVREALLEAEPTDRIAMLTWTSEHYLAEMERFIGEAKALLRTIDVPEADPRLQRDVDRVGIQLDRVGESAQQVAIALDSILGAVTADDNEALDAATQDLDLADSRMHTLLRIAGGMIRRASSWQARHATQPPPFATRLGWLVYGLWCGIAAAWLYRPVGRIAQLARKTPSGPARSREEQVLRTRLSSARTDLDEAQSRLTERTREADRATQSARRAEHELALLKLYNENLVNSLRSAIVVTDAAGRVTGFNRPARDLLDLADAAIEAPIDSLPLFAAFASRSVTARQEAQRAMADRQVLRREGVPFPHPTQGEILLDITVAPYMDESGAARGLLWVSDDVTDAVRIKNQLLGAEHMAAVGRLSAQVAHEIRNPLSAIGLNAEMLEEEFLEGLDSTRRAEALDLLRAIASEVERLTQVTEGYLQLARMPRPSFRDADLNQMVSDLFTLLGEEMKSRCIDVTLELATPAPRAWVDPGQLRQAMLNIVRNSRDAMPGGGTLRVATTREEAFSQIEITDTGEGISPEHLPRVFEPFYSTKPDGTGLGLSLTEQIISEHGGRVEITPGASGGTRVVLHLPGQPGPVAAADPKVRSAKRIPVN